MWYLMTLAGALIGTRIPDSLALDFAVPITFLALIAPMLRTRAHVVAAVVAVAMALSLTWMPYNLGLLVAGLGGMMAGAWTELRLTRGDGA
jgi:predicted branched-subunit amino acid permease